MCSSDLNDDDCRTDDDHDGRANDDDNDCRTDDDNDGPCGHDSADGINLNGEELLGLRAEVDRIHLSPAVQGYILALVRGTRALAERDGNSKRYLTFGASPRASLALYQAGRALAWLRGRDYLSPDLIQELAPDVLRHSIGLTYEAEAEEITPDKIVRQVVERTPVPAT